MQNHDEIVFHYNGKTLNYQVVCACDVCILSANGGTYNNSEIFNLLGIKNKYAFCEDIVGYRSVGDFPEMKSLKDLEKVVNALYRIISEKEKVFNETYKLNFNVKLLKF
jgi:hypothetical protein